MKFKQVSKKEFDDFVKNYPVELQWNVSAIYAPPLGSHNDFSQGKIWPDSMVTKVHLYDTSDYYDGKSPEYFILKESEQ